MVYISNPVSIEIAKEHPVVSVDFGEVQVYGSEVYKGDYTVTPAADHATVLPTAGKRMRNDVNVQEIPYFTTSNPQGGKTVSIATDQIIVLNGGV
jgi:hypothetical protein